MLENKFDIIVIKDQSRLMRNVLDWYLFVDRLNRTKKKLYLYLDHAFYTPDDALITGIKAMMAEEYSKDLSRKNEVKRAALFMAITDYGDMIKKTENCLSMKKKPK